jgi:uncharacterized protein (DUF697 family)
VPLIDTAAITLLQYNMVKEIAAAYGVSFDGDRVRSLVGALLGGAGSTGLGYWVKHSYLKGVPVVGPLLATFSMPGAAVAVTWAVGRVFMQHFSLGGTLGDFDPNRTPAA